MAIAFNKNIGIAHPLLYRDTAFSIVSETTVDSDINYITEKTWTPIVAEHLIISHGNKGNNYFLETLGFIMLNEFVPHYDESDHNKVTDICENLHFANELCFLKNKEDLEQIHDYLNFAVPKKGPYSWQNK